MTLAPTLQPLGQQLKLLRRMPVVFLGHGSPMHAICPNQYTNTWTELGAALPRPKAILVISAHWTTRGVTLVDVSAHPRTVHDFAGFPGELYEESYPAPGSPELAAETASVLGLSESQPHQVRGLDHGAWAVLKFLFPNADVPVFQLSIDISQTLAWHLDLGSALSVLREQGMLILGSGNVVHNLHAMKPDAPPEPWATEFDELFAARLQNRSFVSLSDTASWGPLLDLAHPSREHYIPALNIAGASREDDRLITTTEGIDLASISMRSFVFANI